MSVKPIILIGGEHLPHAEAQEDTIIHAIAAYEGEAPEVVTVQRVFDGTESFQFPTGINRGVTRTRLVYSYSLARWKELMASCVRPSTPEGLRQIMIPILLFMQAAYPGHFQNIEYDQGYPQSSYAEVIALESAQPVDTQKN